MEPIDGDRKVVRPAAADFEASSSEVEDQGKLDNLRIEYEALKVEFEARKLSMVNELEFYGQYMAAVADENGKLPAFAMPEGTLQVIQGLPVEDGFEFRQFAILEVECPDVYELDRHMSALAELLD